MSIRNASFILCLAVCACSVRAAHATLLGPYSVNSNTLHLWHFDEPNPGATVADAVGTSPISLTASKASTDLPGYSAAFGNAADVNPNNASGYYQNTPATGGTDDSPTTTFFNTTTGAFTFEALVLWQAPTVSSGSSKFYEIMSMDTDSTGGHQGMFQFYIHKTTGGMILGFEAPVGVGSFQSSAVGTLTQNTWYHAAVTYDGVPGETNNLKLYWTPVDPSQTSDTLVGTATLASNPFDGTQMGNFAVGNVARNTPATVWAGSLDEVRISNVALGPQQMMFAPEPSSLVHAVLPALMAVTLTVRAHRRSVKR